MNKANVGVIGCGNISERYLKNMSEVFDVLDVRACADLEMDRAKAAAARFPGVRAMTVDELLAEGDIDIVVNLTIPAAHSELAARAIEAGKSIYNEKPLAPTVAQGRELLAAANKRSVLIGGAPDTFMGGGLQTCRKLIDDGEIGRPVAATAFMTCSGHEQWHPNPEIHYKPGGGPMFDMGPYYVTALVALLGPARRITGSTQIGYPTRTIASGPLGGKVIDVEVPTHVAGVVDFACGAVGTIITSFDVWAAELPHIEIYGSEGSLSAGDPNKFGGPVRIRRAGDEQWRDVPLTHDYTEGSRGLGVADMACALRTGRPHRASGQLTYHVLEIMQAFYESSDQGRHIELESTVDRPAPLPMGLVDGEVDE